jgi:hypothetical protein
MSKLTCHSDSDSGFEDSTNFEDSYYTNLRVVYSALGCTSIIPSEGILFVPQEYSRLEKMIEISLKNWHCLLVTGERGLGAFYTFPPPSDAENIHASQERLRSSSIYSCVASNNGYPLRSNWMLRDSSSLISSALLCTNRLIYPLASWTASP